MSLRKTVLNGVDKAFKAVGDLAITLEFRQKTSNGFNFATGSSSYTTSSKMIKAIDISEKQESKDIPHAVMQKQLLVKSKDIGATDTYDSVVIDGAVWSVVHPIESNGFVSTIIVSRSSDAP